jgi:hypothetical protein
MAVRRRNRTNQNIRSIPSLAHQAMNSTIAKTIVAASAAGLATALAHRYCSCREKVFALIFKFEQICKSSLY